jgi:hypothetical protein
MNFYAWVLAFHLLAAFALAAALVLFAVLVFAGRRVTTLEQNRLLFRVAPIGGPLLGAGAGLTLILGVGLALESDRFEIWNGWIIAALVLWALMGAVGQRTGAYYTKIQQRAESGDPGAEAEVQAGLRAPTGALLHVATIAIFLLLLLDMLFKPGA